MATLTDPTVALAHQARRSVFLSIPLLVPVLAGFVWLASAIAHTVVWPLVGWGALGWVVALALRGPVAVVAMKLKGSPEAASPWIVASSGPLEEGLRVAVVLLFGRDLASAMSLGLGWAGIEVLFTVLNGLVATALMVKDDPKAAEARAVMAAQGLLRPDYGLLGVLERVSASAFHIGLTLLTAWQPWVVLVTAPLHSGVNMLVTRPGALMLAEGALALLGLTSFVAGCWLLGAW